MADKLANINPFSNIEVGSMGTMATVLLVCMISVMILLFLAVVLYYFTSKKQYWIRIHVFRLVGNNPTRVAIYRAREVPFGRAGDKLWRIAPCGLSMLFKVIKWLPAGTKQTSSNEFWYWIRKDGEWINFAPVDIDKISGEMNVDFVQEDMRLQRLATEKLLEQRLLSKTFWEKYGTVVVYAIFFLIISVSMVILFFQWSKILEQGGMLIERLDTIITKSQPQSLIPA